MVEGEPALRLQSLFELQSVVLEKILVKVRNNLTPEHKNPKVPVPVWRDEVGFPCKK